MGSPVLVVIANLVMENVEERALETFSTPVKCWKRYIDDVFCVVSRTMVPSLLQRINSIQRSIQFTIENKSREGCLPFLDVHLRECKWLEDIEREDSSLAAFMSCVEECISERECRKFEEGLNNEVKLAMSKTFGKNVEFKKYLHGVSDAGTRLLFIRNAWS